MAGPCPWRPGVHDRIHAGLLQHAQAVPGAEQVAAGDEGDVQGLLEFGQHLVGGLAAEALARRTRVQGDPARAQILEAQGKVAPDMPLAVQAQTDLEAHPVRDRRPGAWQPATSRALAHRPAWRPRAPCLRTLATEQPMLRSNQP